MARRSLLSLLAGALLLASSPLLQALPISDPAAVTPGGVATATADFGSAPGGFFDLLLQIPSEFRLLSIYDDPSDGGIVQYQRYAGPYFESSVSYNGADFTSLTGQFYDISSSPPAGPYTFSYSLFIASNSFFGIRATDLSGGTEGFTRINLELEALSTAALGTHTINYLYDSDGNDTFDWVPASFNIEVVPAAAVPEPAFGLLMLTGLGALLTLGRRRRTWV